MTTLDTRPVTRETNAPDPVKRRRPLVVRMEVGGRLCRIRAKGDRKWYTVTWEQIYRMGCHNRAAEIRQEKADRKKARKEGRA